jgi:hypothetical protein
MKKRIFMGIFGLALSLMFASAVMAQEKAATTMAAPAQKKPVTAMAAPMGTMKLEKFNGVVKNVDMAKKDVVVQYRKDKMSFSVSDNTKLFEGRKELKLSDLNKGFWASVKYQKEGNQMLAQSIQVSPVKQAKNMASSKGMTEKKMMTSKKAAENK